MTRGDREKKIFLAILWSYLVGSLLFFITFLSLGRVVLPAPAWLTYLLLTIGFIVFMFIPQSERTAAGPPEAERTAMRWYPRTVADIIEREGAGGGGRGDRLRAPVHAVAPVPLIPLVLLLVVIALAAPMRPDEGRWRDGEESRLQRIYEKADADVRCLERITLDLAAGTIEVIEGHALGNMGAGEKAVFTQRVDSLAGSVRAPQNPFGTLGIQVYSRHGERLLWGGSPRHLGLAPREGDEVMIYTSKTSMYTLLVCERVDADGRRVTVDIPVEVNYRINNRYLQSTSLGEILTLRYGRGVEFGFSMGEHRGQMRLYDESLVMSSPQINYDTGLGARITGVVVSTAGLPIARLRVSGEPFAAVLKAHEGRKAFVAKLVVTLIVLVIALWVYRVYGKRRSHERGPLWNVTKRVAVLLFFLAVIRLLLLRLELPSSILSLRFFDPAVFADNAPGGLMRTAGDFLITSFFSLILVFGIIKIFRTYYEGRLERRLSGTGGFHWGIAAAKSVLIFAAVAAPLSFCTILAKRVVLNSTEQLVGLDISFFKPSYLSIHVALLFMVSAAFIFCLFVCRLVVVWRGGCLREALFAAGVAFVLLASGLPSRVFGVSTLDLPWPALLSAAGLLVLSIRIFPLLRKEEIISILFASFFIVLTSSMVIYGAASSEYAKLGRSALVERAEDFNHPEINDLQIILPDLCNEISMNRSIAAKVITRQESAAFEIWAENLLSRFNVSCLFEVYDVKNRSFSSFAVGMPFGSPQAQTDTAAYRDGPTVVRVEQETREGTVYHYRGIAPVFHASGEYVGRVEITVPYFFSNPELLAGTGRLAPEIFHNIERGAPARRVDVPEDILVAGVRGNTVTSSSAAFLLTGTKLPGDRDTWFTLETEGGRYDCIVLLKESGEGFLVGYRRAGVGEDLLALAAIVSIDMIITMLSIVLLLGVRKLPVLGSVTPAISLRGGLGFKQKILLSFLAVSILPILVLGAFSSRFFQSRFKSESEKQALSSVSAAVSAIEYAIRSEAESFAGSQYLSDILKGDTEARIRDITTFGATTRFTLFDAAANLLLDEGLSDFSRSEVEFLLDEKNVGRVTMTFDYQDTFGGIVVPVSFAGAPGGYLYYRRVLNDEFIGSIAGMLGYDINLYFQSIVRASSERDLFVGGFLSPLLSPSVFADVALNHSRAVVREESLGDYVYQVASSPITALRSSESGVLSVPMLFEPILIQREVQRTFGIILGLLALLFAATITFGAFLAGKIFTPIAALSGGTRRIIEGDLEFRLEAEAPDEVGELVTSFNTMTAALSKARQDLLERQRYLTAVLDNVATGVMTVDGDGRIVSLNPAGERILHVSRTEMIGRKPEQVGSEAMGPLFDLFSAAGQRSVEREISLVLGEERRTLKAVVTSLHEEGKRLGIVAVFDDLTELIRSNKLAAWVEMARQIAHEVKNPLTPIRLSAQLMRRAYEEGSAQFGEIFKSGVQTVVQQTEILRRIASEFSSFGTAANIKPERLSLSGFVLEFIPSYRGAENVTIHCAVEEDIEVFADREALRKILVNLMENALEAMPGGGEITVGVERAGDTGRITVTDTGTGLPLEVQERLFEPYFSTKTNGTGLGLAICQSLAREMDGDIRLRNRGDGNGVEAIVTLPVAP